jgi:hypothetical protein
VQVLEKWGTLIASRATLTLQSRHYSDHCRILELGARLWKVSRQTAPPPTPRQIEFLAFIPP